jgi:hypothetical protein
MSEAFDAAWSVLKALPEQQMFREGYPRENLGERRNLDLGRLNIRGEEVREPLVDDSGARTQGTVHPAIASMLRRRYNPDGTPVEHGRRYRYGQPPILNVDMGRNADDFIEEARERGNHIPSNMVGRFITGTPKENMRAYDQKRLSHAGEHFDYSEDASGYNINAEEPAPTFDEIGNLRHPDYDPSKPTRRVRY